MRRFYTINETNQEQFDEDWFKEAIKENSLITVNSLSGGKTSSYIASNYPADYNVFALVRTDDKNCLFPDAKLRQFVSDKIGSEFIGTLEDDAIIYTMLDLEQFIGSKIDWVTGMTFDEIIQRKSGVPHLPNPLQRFCTNELKIMPIFNWWRENINEISEFRIGFRANEMNRAKNLISRCNEQGILSQKGIVGKTKNGKRNKWKEFPYQKPTFPLIDNGIFKDYIEQYWKDKPVKFAWMNNCVGCMNNNPLLLKKKFDKFPIKMQWFLKQENKAKVMKKNTWRHDTTYQKIKDRKTQYELFDSDFNECDSGYCGL